MKLSTPAVLKTKEGQWVVLGLVAVAVVYYIGKHVISGAVAAGGAVADAAGGVLSGNNRLTQGTPYEGDGVLGTLGAATNTVSGGALQSIGEWFASVLPGSGNDYDANAGTQFATSSSTAQTTQGVTRSQVVTQNYVSDVSQLF
jgi:hypothetical protein